jgi:hypothetical protein
VANARINYCFWIYFLYFAFLPDKLEADAHAQRSVSTDWLSFIDIVDDFMIENLQLF